MNSARDNVVWRECRALSRCLLPLIDQETWRRDRRHDDFRERGLDVPQGERLLGTFAALTMHTVILDAAAAGRPSTVEALHATALRTVAHTVMNRRDYEFLAAAPAQADDDMEEHDLAAFRLLAYQTGRAAHVFAYLGSQVRATFDTLASRSRTTTATCGDLRQWASQAKLLP
ncbi:MULTISPECIES: hypothetical protein [Streptomyces]|uniref:Uncharacterized protein n=1 Tax=Streptomyces demainii TaxID=588122 RepID=A0ABT9KTU3_9ACTN|nr:MULTISPECIES: hypothetical protein [Streptomyces]MBW8093237.1 hypothetical protein [Streptomyces hygroscopicus subsp. hygroscopicus]MDP9611865.1 hypothetical protein [Streptomyces demainii]